MNLKQVAAVAGVSVSTVSRVLNGKSYVNEETRKIVTEAIRKTNYQPNALAQSLKMGRSNTICLMIPSIENLMFPKLTRGVEDEARKNGMTVFLCNTDEDAAIEKSYLETMKQRWIDGFIVCSLSSDAPHIRSLRDEGYPLVLVNRFEESDIGKVDTVTSDNFQIGYDATRYLARIGHKRIAIVCGREELLLYRERLRGYRKALSDSGLPEREEYLLRESGGSNGFYYQIRELAEQGQLPDAIFCTSDPKAFVVMHALTVAVWPRSAITTSCPICTSFKGTNSFTGCGLASVFFSSVSVSLRAISRARTARWAALVFSSFWMRRSSSVRL